MSAICGILDFSETSSCNALDTMLFMLSHRGVGDPGIWTGKNVCLGFWDLKTLDEDRRIPQPFRDDRTGSVILFDGRLDNRKELCEKLEGAEGMDVQLIAGGYAKWGEEVFSKLLGDFALALWDAKSEKLILVRDPVGVRPLFYYAASSRFLFASEAKAMVVLPGVPRKPNEKRLREFNKGRFRVKETTFFEGIYRVVPGEWLKFDRSGFTRTAFWHPDIHHQICLPSSEAYQEQFRTIFLEAVRTRLPRSGTAAFLLSGGLDSSSVTSAAADIQRREKPDLRLETFSLISNRFPDERKYSNLAAETHGLPNTKINIDEIDLFKDIPGLVFEQEGPFVGTHDPFFRALFSAAAQKGARVVMTGEWGDQLMAGTAILADLLAEGKFMQFWKHFKGFLKDEPLPLSFFLKDVFWFLAAPRFATPKFKKRAQKEIYEGVFYPQNVLVMEAFEFAAARAGLELRMPYLDMRLINFILGIPAEERVKEGLAKRLLRESLTGILPDGIAKRTERIDYTVCLAPRLKEAGFKNDDYRLWRNYVAPIWHEISFK